MTSACSRTASASSARSLTTGKGQSARGSSSVAPRLCALCPFPVLGPLIDASPLKGLLIPLFVKNEFFGGNVDVTGLLCGCDMADAVRAERERGLQLALIPRVVFNDDAVTLDDMSLEDMEKRAGARMSVVSCNASDYLLEIIHLVGRTDPTS